MPTPDAVPCHGPERPSRRQALAVLMGGPWWVAAANAQEGLNARHASSHPPTASPGRVQLARTWPAGRSPEGFAVSEKFDGVRAVWDGQVLRFRSGRVISAPKGFVSVLPEVPLDGELWMGRGTFDKLSGVVRQAVPDEAAWRSLKYLVFDAPGHAGPFAERVRWLQSRLAAMQVPWLMPVTQQSVKDAPALQALLQDTVRQGGEGLMLHRADARWAPGRTEALYKFKSELDEDGLVVGHQAGQGRLKGQTGALLLRLPSGQTFALGSGLSDALRRNPPPIGSWVTYRFRERTPSGLPRFASFWRVRELE